MGDDHYYTHSIFSKQKVRLLTCSFHEVDSTACGKVTEAMLVPTRSTCTQPLLEGTAGYCACAGAVGSREWRGNINVSCDHDATLTCRRVCARALREGTQWHPSDEEVRDMGQRAARRYRAQLAARSLDRPAAPPSAREAIVFTTRILDASMTNCTKDNLASLARTVPNPRGGGDGGARGGDMLAYNEHPAREEMEDAHLQLQGMQKARLLLRALLRKEVEPITPGPTPQGEKGIASAS